jgi:GDP-4-dehydro-6-deoxy-D-mannose reductase
VLVTGGSGFIGGNLSRRLVAHSDTVWSLCRDVRTTNAGRVIAGDILEPASVRRALETSGATTLYHLAGGRADQQDAVRRLNYDGTLNVLRAARDTTWPLRVVVVGSAAEYGAVDAAQQPIREDTPCVPVTTYGEAKLAATQATVQAVREWGLDAVVVRLFNVIGAGVREGQLVGDLIARLRRLGQERPAVLATGPLHTSRDFLAVTDVVDGLLMAAARGRAGEIYNVCSGVATPIRSLVERLITLAGGDIAVREDASAPRSSDVPLSYGSWAKAGEELGFVPRVPLDTALEDAWRDARSLTDG